MYNKELGDLRKDEAFLNQERYDLGDLAKIIAFLASDQGCPWDRIQTPDSLKRHLLEETYEAYDAIVNADEVALREELGDMLLQIVFQANLAQTFTLDDVVHDISQKMIRRHTHVFAEDQAAASSEVLDIWEANKRKEKQQGSHSAALDGIARALPALMRAEKIQAKAKKAGFDWDSIDGPREKIAEELIEAEAARQALVAIEEARPAKTDSQHDDPMTTELEQAKNDLEIEVGDLLFSVVNWARHAGVDPEIALERSNGKFVGRFAKVEERIEAEGLDMTTLSLEELDRYWDQAK